MIRCCCASPLASGFVAIRQLAEFPLPSESVRDHWLLEPHISAQYAWESIDQVKVN